MIFAFWYNYSVGTTHQCSGDLRNVVHNIGYVLETPNFRRWFRFQGET